MSKKPTTTHVLAQSDLQSVIQSKGMDFIMDELIDVLNKTILDYQPSMMQIPLRSGFNYTVPATGLVEWMPAYKKGAEVVIKVVGYHPDNPENQSLPTILSTISSYNTVTGHLSGIMDGVLPTALRTGAASAVASMYMAKEDSSVLGLIGLGAQSITQLHALSRKFPITSILIYDIDQQAIESFRQRVQCLDLDVEISSSSVVDIVSSSDILCTATSIPVGKGPLFDDMETKPHLHINAVGSDFPGKTELPYELLKRSFVCPDFREQAKIEGECQRLLNDQIDASLDLVVKNSAKFNEVKNHLSVFDSTGWALEDVVVFDLLMDYAERLSLGQHVDLEYIPEDAKNPYEFLAKEVELTISTKDGYLN